MGELFDQRQKAGASDFPYYPLVDYQYCFISAAFVGMAASSGFLVMIKYGKGMRVRSSSKYYRIVDADKAMN